MHIKWTRHGRGSARAAAAYLLRGTDAAGRARSAVSVRAGDPRMVAAVADSSGFAWTYSSAVIAWAPTDAPTQEQIDAVVAEFGAAACAGMPENGTSWTAVQHGRAGEPGVHVHVLVARVELHSGRAWNPAPPGWQKRDDALRDAWNAAQGWARPDDPGRSRAGGGGARPWPAGQAAGREEVQRWREDLTRWAVAEVAAGRAGDRAALIGQLRAAGVEVARETRSSVSVLAGESRVRLTGAVWGKEWAEPPTGAGRPGRENAGPLPDPAGASLARERLADALARQIAHNRRRYAKAAAAAIEEQQRLADQAGPVIPSGSGGGADGRDHQTAHRVVEQAERASRGLDAASADLDAAARSADEGLAAAGRNLAAASADLERAGGRVERALAGYAAAARRAWTRLKGWWQGGYPPDQPPRRQVAAPSRPARPAARSSDPLLGGGWSSDGPGRGTGRSR